jgi:hypothetical protein
MKKRTMIHLSNVRQLVRKKKIWTLSQAKAFKSDKTPIELVKLEISQHPRNSKSKAHQGKANSLAMKTIS